MLAQKLVTARSGEDNLLDFEVPDKSLTRAGASLSPKQLEEIAKAAHAFFTAPKEKQAHWSFEPRLNDLLLSHEAAVRFAVWKAYQQAPIHADGAWDFERNQVRYQHHVSPYMVKRVGKRSEHGWPLFIAMHGGGGVPKEINDKQWQVMKGYYRDQSSVTGYQYLALRAPNDTWNGFYDTYMPPLIINLIRQFLLFGDVDPDKVFLMGYSHGGYGAFYTGPKIPDRFAAIHASAAAPTDGTISARCLRNTHFTYMIGETDNDYGRRKRCEAFAQLIQKLRVENPDDFNVAMEMKSGFGHRGLPDRDKIKGMYPFTRSPVPKHLTWELKDNVIHHFFWLSVPEPADKQTLEARIQDNTLDISSRNVKQFEVSLDERLVNFDKPLRINLNGKISEQKVQPSFLTLCQSIAERGDPGLAFVCHLPMTAER
jgi:pimeloyl-ACP methyl ester carboxylesterase